MSHLRGASYRLVPEIGDILVSQKREPVVKLVEDTSPGVHDTLIPPCDRWRYAQMGFKGYHENCTDNCWDALHTLYTSPSPTITPATLEALKGLQAGLGGRVPDPLNLWMNVPLKSTGKDHSAKQGLTFEEPVSKAGDYVVLEALRDVVVVMSACPQDLVRTNGDGPVDAHFQILE